MIRQSSAARRPNRLANRKASPFSKQSIAHAARVMAPTFFALAISSVAQAQGTMDFSGAQTLMGTFKNHIVYVVLARKVFGREYMKVVGDRVQSLLREWGYLRTGTLTLVLRTIFEGLLYKRSLHLDQLKIEDLQEGI